MSIRMTLSNQRFWLTLRLSSMSTRRSIQCVDRESSSVDPTLDYYSSVVIDQDPKNDVDPNFDVDPYYKCAANFFFLVVKATRSSKHRSQNLVTVPEKSGVRDYPMVGVCNLDSNRIILVRRGDERRLSAEGCGMVGGLYVIIVEFCRGGLFLVTISRSSLNNCLGVVRCTGTGYGCRFGGNILVQKAIWHCIIFEW